MVLSGVRSLRARRRTLPKTRSETRSKTTVSYLGTGTAEPLKVESWNSIGEGEHKG